MKYVLMDFLKTGVVVLVSPILALLALIDIILYLGGKDQEDLPFEDILNRFFAWI